MLNTDEDAVICDLAEVYHIYDWRSLPLRLVATFVCGLGQNSRIYKKITGQEYTTEHFLLANIADALSILIWQNSKKGTKKPKFLTDKMMKETKKNDTKKNDTLAFDTPEEFDLLRKALLRSGTHG